ncbi:hypothetical protein D9M69_696180 [compost metagenome]
MVVGQQITFRAHDHGRAQARLHAFLARQVLAEVAAEQRIVEHRVGRFADDLGGIEVGHRRGRVGHRIGVAHRTFLKAGDQWRLLQVNFLLRLRQAEPLRILLDDQ